MTLRDEPQEPPTRPIAAPPPPPSPPAGETAMAIVDHTFHFAALFTRAGVYVLLALTARHYDFGAHLLAGVLFGDFAGFAAGAVLGLRQARAAAVAELALFTLVFLFWWHRYDWPATTEFRALFGLAAFGVLTTRLGLSGLRLLSTEPDRE